MAIHRNMHYITPSDCVVIHHHFPSLAFYSFDYLCSGIP